MHRLFRETQFFPHIVETSALSRFGECFTSCGNILTVFNFFEQLQIGHRNERCLILSVALENYAFSFEGDPVDCIRESVPDFIDCHPDHTTPPIG